MLQSIRRTAVRTVVGGAVVLSVVEWTTHLPSEGRSSRLYHDAADRIVTPLVRYISNPEHAHTLAVQWLRDYPQWTPTHRPSAVEQSLTVEQNIAGGLIVPNPIGMAAGFDKDAEGVQALLQLGFGFVEVGSVCVRAQPGNPSPRMFRLLEDDAIINRYAFNSQGVETVKANLQRFRSSDYKGNGLVGVNLGKNANSETPLEDYQELIRELGPLADYLVVNVSCPNQAEVQDLQSTDNLIHVLSACDEARKQLETTTTPGKLPPPLFVKLSPDMDEDQMLAVAATLMELKKDNKVDGIIVSNTTTERLHGLQSKHRSETGGLSGRPLTHKSTECIRFLYAATQGELPIIGVGGIFTAKDVMDKIKAGASVVQIYTGMVIQGPGTVSKLRHEVAVLLKENGVRSIEEMIGLDHEDLYWKRRYQAAGVPQQQKDAHTTSS